MGSDELQQQQQQQQQNGSGLSLCLVPRIALPTRVAAQAAGMQVRFLARLLLVPGSDERARATTTGDCTQRREDRESTDPPLECAALATSSAHSHHHANTDEQCTRAFVTHFRTAERDDGGSAAISAGCDCQRCAAGVSSSAFSLLPFPVCLVCLCVRACLRGVVRVCVFVCLCGVCEPFFLFFCFVL